ncbi:DUF4097 domain-containing protein [Paenibacillus sp. CC-CFT747]|nr:DUF4097 domain-containing protein [Paenibacillus sp. CC-CFT747]
MPAKLYDSVSFRTNTGRLTAEGLQAKSLSLETDTGAIALKNSDAGQLSAESSTGSLTLSDIRGGGVTAATDTGSIRLAQIEGALKVESGTGSVEVTVPRLLQPIQAETDTGSIRIQAAQAGDVRVDFRTDTGRVSADVPGLSYAVRDKHELRSTGGSGPLVKAESSTGSITLTTGR